MERLFFLLLVLPLLAAQTTTEVELTSEPSHHLALQNEYVRVFQVEAVPHAATLLHRHRHDYFFVTLGDTDISNEVEGKAPVELKLADGDVRFAQGPFAHVVRNLSDKPFRNVTIEILQDEKLRQTRSRWPMEGGGKTFPGGSVKILLVRDAVRVSETDFDPGATLPSERHDGPRLLVAVSDLDLRSGEATPWKLKPGDVKWLPGGDAPTLTNVGMRAARFVTLEI